MTPKGKSTLASLRRAARDLPVERYQVDRPVNPEGEYQLELSPEFPFAIKHLVCRPGDPLPPLTWHTYLEVFVHLSDQGLIRMGRHEIRLAAGDMLLMDNLRLHTMRTCGGDLRWIVVRFLPEFVLGLAPLALDRLLLVPFYYTSDEGPRVVRVGSATAFPVYEALGNMLRSWPRNAEDLHTWRAGTKVRFVNLLYHLARFFRSGERFETLHSRQRLLNDRLSKLFQHIETQGTDHVSVAAAASIAGLGRSRFSAVFREATGTTLVDYLHQLRLDRAARLLKETDRSIAAIATDVGFSDQSYFGRRFRRRFRMTPVEYRHNGIHT